MNTDSLFSILIPTWNNLPYLQLCVESIRKNSSYIHEILIYVNDGSDGTLEWVKEHNIKYLHNESNIGICFALNSLRRLVTTDYILYMNDDMYVCPKWDEYLWNEIDSLPDNMFFISSTMIQPNVSISPCKITGCNFGDSVETFKEAELLSLYDKFPFNDWQGSTWPPNVVHRDVWDMIGGYSIEFSPGMYSDPDFTAKLWLAGVRHFKGISKSRVYHFECKSTGRIKKNNGSAQFLLKYGISTASFMRNIIHPGSPFKDSGYPINKKRIIIDRIRYKIKRLAYISRDFMTKKIWEP